MLVPERGKRESGDLLMVESPERSRRCNPSFYEGNSFDMFATALKKSGKAAKRKGESEDLPV